LGKGKNLTPPNPQFPQAIVTQLQNLGFTINTYVGIIWVFHDYLTQDTLKESGENELFELEYQHCRLSGFREMGRYVHLLARREN
jgi:S-adenosylmethionine-dependent methyltransferase